MRILLTGHGGIVGSVLHRSLVADGHDIVGFDRAQRRDVLNLKSLRRHARGCDAIVHAAAIPADRMGSPEQIMTVNALGTWNVLLVAEEVGARVVYFSSAQVLGAFYGENQPDYLPIDDDHPRRGARPYGLSKRIGEDMCEAFTLRTGLGTVCLRPVWVWDESRYRSVWRSRNENPSGETLPFWEFGAFVDLRDVVTATALALGRAPAGHTRALLASDDISASRPAREMVEAHLPNVEWRGGDEYCTDPWRGLVDCSRARDVLGWTPQYRWADWLAEQGIGGIPDTSRA